MVLQRLSGRRPNGMRKRTGENIINFWHCILLPFHRDETPAVSVWQHASRWNALGQVGATEAVVIFPKSCIELQCSFPRIRRLWGNSNLAEFLLWTMLLTRASSSYRFPLSRNHSMARRTVFAGDLVSSCSPTPRRSGPLQRLPQAGRRICSGAYDASAFPKFSKKFSKEHFGKRQNIYSRESSTELA